MRILSVCPSNTDLLHLLGALPEVVGRDSWSDWPLREVSTIPLIGSVLNVDYEKVVALEPDLIVASKNVPGMDRVVAKLETLGLPMVIYDPETWSDVLANIADLGERLGRRAQARELIEKCLAGVEELKALSSDRAPIDVAVEFWPNPVFVPSGLSYISEVLSWVRCRNVTSHFPGRSGKITLEEVVQLDPEIYFVSWCGTPWREYDLSSVYQRYAPWNPRFVQNALVFPIWEGIIGHPSPRLIDGARQILQYRNQVGV